MTRRGSSGELPAEAGVPTHRLLLHGDLVAWAGEQTAQAGRRDALLGRVELLRMTLDGASLEARVRGRRALPHRVRVQVVEDRMTSDCSCAPDLATPCRHAVAALETLRFPRPPVAGGGTTDRGRKNSGRVGRGQGRIIRHGRYAPGVVLIGASERTRTRQERIALSREEELIARRRSARAHRAWVRPVAEANGPLCYDVQRPRASAVERVSLRGAGGERMSCTCGDFADNELQTCEHIERVRRWRVRQRKCNRTQPPAGLASVWCQPRAWVERRPDVLQEIRFDGPAPPPAPHFDADGWLRAAPAGTADSAWARAALRAVEALARARGWDLDVGAEVRARMKTTLAEQRLDRRRAVIDRDEEPLREVFEALHLELHPYQRRGAAFLARAGRALLADDMGLGKTVQAVAAARVLRRTAGARKALIVCPASLKYQWRREIAKICGEGATVVEGARSGRLAAYAAWDEGFLVLNYELVVRDLDAIQAAAADLIVLDEAQRIKNWETKTARAVKQLRSPHAFILTGTPLENRLPELHSLVEFLHPRAMGPRWRVLPFHQVTDAHGRVIAYEALDALRRRLEGFFLRRERGEVLDQLPDRTENEFWTGMTTAQLRPYRRYAASTSALLSKRGALPPPELKSLLRALTHMRVLCNSHAQYAWDRHAERLALPDPPTKAELRALGSPKLEEFSRVLEELLDESDEKVVVFSQWQRMLRLAAFAIRGMLEERELRAETFHGGLPARARDRMLETFRRDPEFRVLFSTDAGGLGLNLQEAASIVINLEVPWNPAVLEQRIGRVHRIGQRRSVRVLHFITRGAIEQRVRQVVEDKRALFSGLLVERADEVIFDERTRSTFVDRLRRLVDAEQG